MAGCGKDCDRIRTAEERGKDATQLKESVAASRREIDRATEATKDILLGEVLASSGNVNQGAGTTLYDWAVIRVRPERVEGDRSVLALPPQPSSSESDQLLNRLSSLRRMDVLRSWESSIEEGRPKGKQASLAEILQDEDDERPCAILHGRSSGYAVGYINGARDDVRLKLFGEEVRGRLYAIINPRDRSSFSRSGDSGAAVYDRYARLLGTLVRGNDRGEQIGVSYVVPIQETLDHMKSTLDNTPLKMDTLEII
ncbi:hypothetical protein SPI_04010 [Niveomyces insectorum RCEF 264]|uniref:Uncharacterized protein n=1 Tax=Niveomyces insectorum RCEF 264 TaxID=1081102 RepID=A0A167VCR1_9HYPO|nr:hypothetical protein SPI_04010 [Niveomyces insectorum RCEF 264]